MPKNIVICCDGTGNEISANLSNVLKLFRVLKKSDDQVVFYDPGIGTIDGSDPWSRLKTKSNQVFGLATGSGLDKNILDAYRFLMKTYEDGDQVYLFGFSRGAYTVRALAGFLRLVGLLNEDQTNLCSYAMVAYKRAAENNDLSVGWRFQRITSAQWVPVKFLGVWDTVSSVLVPRKDRLYIPSLQHLPYTANNDFVEVCRHAVAIDERRRMFRAYHWGKNQKHRSNPFADLTNAADQDSKQVWFAGVHSDVGGGYPEEESGLAKFPLKWMIDEAYRHGLLVSKTMYRNLVMGNSPNGNRSKQSYTPPNVEAEQHDSMNLAWKILEFLPKRSSLRESPQRRAAGGVYLPAQEHRYLPEGAIIHHSADERTKRVPDYNPRNLPATYSIEPDANPIA